MTSSRRGPRFLLTRVAVAVLAVASFVGFWASIAFTNQPEASEPETAAYEVIGVQEMPGDRYVDSEGNPLRDASLPPQAIAGSAPPVSSTQDQPQPRAPTARRSRGS